MDGVGDILVTGYYTGSVNFGGSPLTSAGNYDAFLVKFAGIGVANSTPTATQQPLLTATPTQPLAPTDTPVQPPTAIATPTQTPTYTPTDTPTRTPTRTASRTPTRTRTRTPAALTGDANKDGNVDVIDAALVLQRTAGILPSINPGAGVNGDGRVDSIDALLILQYVAGLISAFP